ncbi:MAG: hypothetical protein U1D55_06700 [Phycisphaerae bacterium]
MSMMSSGPGAGRSAENDIYTALMVIAFLFTLAALVYLIYRTNSLFGGLLPPGGS